MMFASSYPGTFTLYKLHGSTTWYASSSETTFDPIYGLSHLEVDDPRYRKFVGDKRRFIVPPVYDKSSLLNHESIRNLWWQANARGLSPADRVFVVGYSLPETDVAMRTLFWQGRQMPSGATTGQKKQLYVVDIDGGVGQRYLNRLGQYYDVRTDFVGGDNPFDRFVDEYTST